MSTFKSTLKRAWRESRGLNKITSVPLAVLFSYLLESGKTTSLIKIDLLIGKITLPIISSYYVAHAYYLHGRYNEARKHLTRITLKHPNHADATYLLCDIDVIEGKRSDAWHKITKLAKHNRRLKTWLMMANLVENELDFSRLYTAWRVAVEDKYVPPYHLEVNGYIATGALRAGLYDRAITLWEEFLSEIANKKAVARNSPKQCSFSQSKAEKALLDIKSVLDKKNIEFFLVSGTLLGCIREGRLLAHDKDADIGVWSNYTPEDILIQLRTSGLFYIQASRSSHVIRAKHVNGTAIDIFFHYREEHNYWHGGVKLKWSNTPFNLISHPFLGESFNIPENYDLYLTENYGNWREPQKNFDSTTDTTNATTINNAEMIVSIYRKLAEASLDNSYATIKACLLHLENLATDHPFKKVNS